MNEEQKDNIQRGLAEIWRREKLAVASIGLSSLFALLVCVPIGYFIGGSTPIPMLVFLVPVALVFKCSIWVASTPCPKCGHPYGGLTVKRKCVNCGLPITKPQPVKYDISFKKIEYQQKKKPANQKIKRTENSWLLPEKQNQIAVVGRNFSSPPLIANR